MSFDADTKIEIEFTFTEGKCLVVLPHRAIDTLAAQALDAGGFNFAEVLAYLGVSYRGEAERKFWKIFDQMEKFTNTPFDDEYFDTALIVGVINGGEVGARLFDQLIAPENTIRTPLEVQ